MAVGDIVTAARFNNLQARIATVMGVGGGAEGYGQSLDSNSVLTSADVNATDMSNLYLDMTKARFHQVGALPTEIENIIRGDIILDDNAAPFDPKSFAAFENLMIDIEADKYLLSSNAATAKVETGISSSRSTAWNGAVSYEFVVQFADVNARRYFFNSGGEIRITSNVSGGSQAKSSDWRLILSNVGVVKFNYASTTSTGTGTGSLIGNYDITASETKIFTKVGSDVSAAYAENEYNIYASQLSPSEIKFKVEFLDADIGDPNFDENVDGTTSTSIQHFRAAGTYVEVDAPGYYTVSPLG
jgi:hypothetical protein